MIRYLKIAIVAISVVLLTTGCVKFNLDLEVKQDDTVSGTMVFAIAKGLAELGDQSQSGSTSPETEGLLGNTENVKVEPFDDGAFVGSSYIFESVPLDEFQPSVADGSSFELARVGDEIVLSGVLQFTGQSDEQEDNPWTEALLQGVMNSTDIRVSITLPGEIRETNGEVEGQTITWKGTLGDDLEMNAISYAPKISPYVFIVASSVLVGLVVGILTLVVLRVRRRLESNQSGAQRSLDSLPAKTIASSRLGLSDSDIKVLEGEYATNPERFAMDYLSSSEFKKWRDAGEPSLKPWIAMGMVNFRKWLDLHK